MKAVPLGLALAAGLVAGLPVAAQPAATPRSVVAASEGASPLLTGEVALQPRQLAQLVALRSPEIRFSRIGVDVAGELSRAESALYETVLFGNVRGEDRSRQRTVEERLASAGALSVLDERTAVAEAGVRQRLPTAGEVSVSYRIFRRRNNIIANANATGNQQDTEYTSAAVVSLKQPLLRNSGRGVLETDRRLAELEHQVQWVQFRQQVLKSTADALNLYWQLHRAQQGRQLRDESLQVVRRMMQDVDARVEAGRAPPANRIELRSTVLAREADLTRTEQAAREAESRVMTALALSTAGNSGLRLRAGDDSAPDLPPLPALDAVLDRALEQWPPYQLAQLRLEQARVRLRYAENQRKPALDLVASYSSNGLAYERRLAENLVGSDRYPEWTIGLNLEMPLAGNGRASGQSAAQALRVRQGELEMDAIRDSLANDLAQRRDELQATAGLLAQAQQDLELRQALLEGERTRYTMGLGQLNQWLQRENDLLDARQRLLEARTRAQLARVAWLFAQGSLLAEHDIALRTDGP